MRQTVSIPACHASSCEFVPRVYARVQICPGFARRWSTQVIDSKEFPRGKLNPLVLAFSNHTQVSLPIR